MLPCQALLMLESPPLVCNKTRHMASKAECVCAERIALPWYSLMSPSWGTCGRTGVCGPHEIHAARTVTWCHRKPSWIGGKLVKCGRKDVCTWKAKKPNWRGDSWEVGMWPSVGGLGGCTRLLPHTEGGSSHRSPEMLHSSCSPSPNCSGYLSCQVYKRWHLLTKDRWEYFL